MIRKSFDGHIPPVDTNDSFNYADIDLFGIERASLFNVQFEIGGYVAFLAPHVCKFRNVSTDELDAFANGLAAATHQIEFLLSQLAVHRATTDQSTFFVLKDDNLKRVSQCKVVFRECLCDFNCAHRSDHAVVISTFRNRIDVRSDQQRQQTAYASCATPNQITRGINRHVQLRSTHQTEYVLTSLFIGIAVCHPTDAALRVFAKLREGENVVHDPLAVDANTRLQRQTSKRKRSQRKSESVVELATVDFHRNEM